MSRAGIAVTVMFLGLAVAQITGLFEPDPEPLPPPVTIPATPTPTPTPTKTEPLEPFPKFTGPKPEPVAYESTQELVDALAARGIDCTPSYLDQPDPTLAEFSLCDPGTSDRRFNIYLYASPAARKSWLRSMKMQKLPLPLVWGPNWIVVAAGEPKTAMSRIRSIAGAIGGTVEDFSPKKS